MSDRPDTCYRCGRLRILERGGLCPTCKVEVHNIAHAKPQAELCDECGYRYRNDWERMKHEVLGNHRYRSTA